MSTSTVFVGLAVDVSGSMRTLTKEAQADYDNFIESIQPVNQNQRVHMSLHEFGGSPRTHVVYKQQDVQRLPAYEYCGYGSTTPLYDGVGAVLTELKYIDDRLRAAAPDGISTADFLVAIITDGGENDSRGWSRTAVRQLIQELNQRDNWTITMRTPKAYVQSVIVDFGMPAGNVQGWETTQRGMTESTTVQRTATRSYMTNVASGVRKTTSFYANTADLSTASVQKALEDITHQVTFYDVTTDAAIRPFVESKTNASMIKGAAFYQLTKTEDTVQPYKVIAVREVATGKVYVGNNARAMLGLPEYGNIRVRPSDHTQFEVFIQSTSVNRSLKAGTKLMYWPWFANPAAGPSAPAAKTPSVKAPVVKKQAAKKATTTKKAAAKTPVTSTLTQYEEGVKDGKAAATRGDPLVVSVVVNEYGRGYKDGYASVQATNAFEQGYREGFPHGKQRTPYSYPCNSPQSFVEGYVKGYKDGKNKKKNLYK